MARDGAYKTYILYDAAKLLNTIDSVKKKYSKPGLYKSGLTRPTQNLNEFDEWDLGTFMKKCVVATIQVSKPHYPSYGAKEIERSAADQGYGPLMYDIVMALEGGLIPDRCSVSSAARGVWKYYFQNRSDVDKEPLDTRDLQMTKTKQDDATSLHAVKKLPVDDREVIDNIGGPVSDLNDDYPDELKTKLKTKLRKLTLKEPLDQAYFIKKSPATTKLFSNHSVVVKKLSKLGLKKAKFINAIDFAATEYFDSMYF